MISVVQVIKGLGPGGAEQLLVDHMTMAADHPDATIVYSVVGLVKAKNHHVAALERLGVPVSLIGSGPGWPFRLVAAVRRANPDVVHVHSPALAAIVRGAAALRILRTAVVTTEHNRWPRHHRLTRFANRLTAPSDDHRFAVSADVANTMTPGLARDTEVLTHGIPVPLAGHSSTRRTELRAQLEMAPEAVAIGIVANFRPEKGYDTFLAATEIASAANPHLHFFVIGQGPGEAAFRAAATADNIHVLGYRADARDLLQAFDIFTLSSRHEGLPVSVMEALASGLPVVATRAGGIPEMIQDGVEGVLVDIDNAASLAQGWLRLASDPTERAKFGQAAAEAADRFDGRRAVSRLEEIYRSLNSRRSSRLR